MQKLKWFIVVALSIVPCCQLSKAQSKPDSVCPRPDQGSIVQDPEELRSQHGVLEAELTAHNVAEPDGATRYCYSDAAGRESVAFTVDHEGLNNLSGDCP